MMMIKLKESDRKRMQMPMMHRFETKQNSFKKCTFPYFFFFKKLNKKAKKYFQSLRNVFLFETKFAKFKVLTLAFRKFCNDDFRSARVKFCCQHLVFFSEIADDRVQSAPSILFGQSNTHSSKCTFSKHQHSD